METKANHVLIGTFTLLVVLGVLGFILWIARFDEAAGRQPVYVIFEGAVTGLSDGAGVLFNGIKVGEVARLRLDPDDPEKVRALIYVDSDAPVKKDTAARLDAQGLTGVAVVQLLGGSKDSPSLWLNVDSEIPVIIAEKSQFQDLFDSVRDIASRGASLFERLDKLLEDNEAAVGKSIKNIETFTTSLSDSSDDVKRFIKDASELAARLNKTSENLDALIARTNEIVSEDGAGFMKEAREAAETFRELAENLNEGLGEGVSRVAGRGVREFEAFVVEGRSTLRNMQRVIDRLDRDPKSFFLGGKKVPEHRGR